MELYYCNVGNGNFGDDMNAWLWPDLLPDAVNKQGSDLFIGIGTILDDKIQTASQKYVFGSGIGYNALPLNISDNSWHVEFVRGPLTAKVLGLNKSKAITDSAIAIALHPEFRSSQEKSGIVFMPHHSSAELGKWGKVCQQAGIEYLDPQADSKQLAKRIATAELVIAEAMHAAIVADALRVPWIPVVTSVEVNSFKWLDWTLSMGMDYEPYVLPHSSLMEKVRDAFIKLEGRADPLTLKSEPGEKISLTQNDAQAVVEAYQASLNTPTQEVRNIFARVLCHVCWRLLKSKRVKRFVNMSYSSPSIALKEIAQKEGSLSSSRTFKARLKKVESLLSDLTSA